MASKSCIVMIVLVAATAELGSCVRKEITEVGAYPHIHSQERIRDMLDTAIESADVALALGRLRNRNETIDGVSLEQLYQLNSYDTDVDCTDDKIAERMDLCEKVEGNLLNYCLDCLDELKRDCDKA